jgi:hypothetical protein
MSQFGGNNSQAGHYPERIESPQYRTMGTSKPNNNYQRLQSPVASNGLNNLRNR